MRGGGSDKPGQGDGVWHVVQPGESLSGLSRRSGLTVAAISAANSLDRIPFRPGLRLWLPGITVLPPDPLAWRPPPKPERLPTTPVESDGAYELVPRSAWTSEPVGPNHVLMDKVQRITVHHTDEHGGMEGKSDLEVVRMIERYHREQKKWAAIGYHYLVGKDGKIYEGRPVKFQGAHCGDNANNLGISVIGDCHRNLPNAKQLKALKAFLDDKRARFDVSRGKVFGHRDIKPTICPGDMLYAWVLQYSGRAAK